MTTDKGVPATVPYKPDLLRDVPEESNLMERAYRTLKRDIIELRRPPGTSFSEPAVAAALGLSKTPVREALARLHRDGLVTPVPRAGYVVSPVTLRDAAELCDMRTLLQSEAAHRCAVRGLEPGTAGRLGHLAADDRHGPLDGPGFEARLRADYEFEAIIADGSGSARLARSVVNLLDELERVARLAMRLAEATSPDRARQRLAIAEAITEGDGEAARDAMRARTRGARKEILDALSSSPAIVNASILLA